MLADQVKFDELSEARSFAHECWLPDIEAEFSGETLES